jgi:hypothetical protein
MGVVERALLRDRVLVPLCRLLPAVRSVEVRSDRDVDGWGKGEYNISLPGIMRALGGGSRPLRAEAEGVREKRLVTLTLREAEHHPLRNSRVDEWIAAARMLQEEGLGVVVVRDALRAREPIPGLLTAPWASEEVARRAALYSAAAVNVGICNGPMWMSIFMGAPTLMLRPTTNAARGCYDDRFYARWGLPRGAQLPTTPANQRLVWEEDDREIIVRAVVEMVGGAA